MAPVSIIVKPSRRASCRATVLLPAPAGPSIATMWGGCTGGGITHVPRVRQGRNPCCGSEAFGSGVQSDEEGHPRQRNGGHCGGQPERPRAQRGAVGLRLLLSIVARLHGPPSGGAL